MRPTNRFPTLGRLPSHRAVAPLAVRPGMRDLDRGSSMDDRRIDDLARLVGGVTHPRPRSRRAALRLLAGGAFAALGLPLVPRLGRGAAAAAQSCRPLGAPCSRRKKCCRAGTCAIGTCICTGGRWECDDRCLDAATVCRDRTCGTVVDPCGGEVDCGACDPDADEVCRAGKCEARCGRGRHACGTECIEGFTTCVNGSCQPI